MWHVRLIQSAREIDANDLNRLVLTATGRFYTDLRVAVKLAESTWNRFDDSLEAEADEFSVADPFCGDGRLVCALLKETAKSQRPLRQVNISLWDIDPESTSIAHRNIQSISEEIGISVNVDSRALDTFLTARTSKSFDIVITNPPWEILKPDRRELSVLSEAARQAYISRLRDYDEQLARLYPLSQPARRFAGWGTNLARVGIEASLILTRRNGILGVVSPASILADDVSQNLRICIFETKELVEVNYYPAEARLYGAADIDSCTMVIANRSSKLPSITVRRFCRNLNITECSRVDRSICGKQENYTLPLKIKTASLGLRACFNEFPTFGDLEGKGRDCLWAGRELDESNLSTKLSSQGKDMFLKGRMIERYTLLEQPTQFVRPGLSGQASARQSRIAWRDVARPTQKRRMKATLIPPGWVCGNSINIAYYRDGDQYRLRCLLALMNSAVFEWQLRAILSTGHVSLSSVRKVRLPRINRSQLFDEIASTAEARLAGDADVDPRLEALAAIAYGLSEDQLTIMLSDLPGLDQSADNAVTREFRRMKEKYHIIDASLAHYGINESENTSQS